MGVLLSVANFIPPRVDKDSKICFGGGSKLTGHPLFENLLLFLSFQLDSAAKIRFL